MDNPRFIKMLGIDFKIWFLHGAEYANNDMFISGTAPRETYIAEQVTKIDKAHEFNFVAVNNDDILTYYGVDYDRISIRASRRYNEPGWFIDPQAQRSGAWYTPYGAMTDKARDKMRESVRDVITLYLDTNLEEIRFQTKLDYLNGMANRVQHMLTLVNANAEAITRQLSRATADVCADTLKNVS